MLVTAYSAAIQIILVVMILAAITSLQVRSPAKARIHSSHSIQSGEIIHPGDLLDVDVVGSTDFDWRGTLNPEGFLDGIRFVEDGVFARCRTTDSVAQEIRDSFARFLNEPKVKVSILDRSGREPAVIYGAVRSPQRFRLLRDVRLAELIVLSGGITDAASGTVSILRQPGAFCGNFEEASPFGEAVEGGSARILTLELNDLLSGNERANPFILYGDVITIAESLPVYLVGGVSKPGSISFREGLTVSRAVDSAGGLAKDAEPGSVTILRRSEGTSEAIRVDLEQIRNGAADDIELRAYDIVNVSQRGGFERRFAPLEGPERSGNGHSGTLPIRIIDR